MPEVKPTPSSTTETRQAKTPKRKKRNRHWESLIGPYEAGDYLVVPLICTDDLRTEGNVMNHCIGRLYPTSCKLGLIRAFSIRDLDGRRLATVSLEFDYLEDRWKLEQCKGYGNINVSFEGSEPTDLHFLVADLVRLYQQAQENHYG
jgi:hypothetical protein